MWRKPYVKKTTAGMTISKIQLKKQFFIGPLIAGNFLIMAELAASGLLIAF
jgi:hypothetical protein